MFKEVLSYVVNIEILLVRDYFVYSIKLITFVFVHLLIKTRNRKDKKKLKSQTKSTAQLQIRSSITGGFSYCFRNRKHMRLKDVKPKKLGVFYIIFRYVILNRIKDQFKLFIFSLDSLCIDFFNYLKRQKNITKHNPCKP